MSKSILAAVILAGALAGATAASANPHKYFNPHRGIAHPHKHHHHHRHHHNHHNGAGPGKSHHNR